MPESYYKNYYSIVYALLIGIFICVAFIIGIVIKKNKKKKTGKKLRFYKFLIIAYSLLSICFSCFLTGYLLDYKYVKNKTYEEGIADFIGYKEAFRGRFEINTTYQGLIFYFANGDFTITFNGNSNTKQIEVGKKYLVRYWPNIKECYIVKEVKVNLYLDVNECFI